MLRLGTYIYWEHQCPRASIERAVEKSVVPHIDTMHLAVEADNKDDKRELLPDHVHIATHIFAIEALSIQTPSLRLEIAGE